MKSLKTIKNIIKRTLIHHAIYSFVASFVILSAMILPLQAQTFSLADYPFETDHILDHPFVGGLNSPQFSEIDLNRDGQMDLFVFDRVGHRVLTFLRDKSIYPYYRYAPAYQKLFPDLNDWVLIRDYNADGIPDIIASDTIPIVFGVQFYKGHWDGSQLSWELVQLNQGLHNVIYFEAEDFTMRQLEVIPGDKPAIQDVDGDGDMDILNFDAAGSYVVWYQNMAVERGLSLDQLVFKRTDPCWGKFLEVGSEDAQVLLSDNPNDCYQFFNDGQITPRHVGSTLTLYDHDQNDIYDLLLGDIANDGVLLLENTGTARQAFMTRIETDFPARDTSIKIRTFVSTFVIDVNADGINDIIASPNEFLNTENVQVAQLYTAKDNTNNISLQLTNRNFLTEDMIDLSQGSHPAIVDYNADGLWDIVIGVYGRLNNTGRNTGQLFLFENNGTAVQPSFKLVTDDWLGFKIFGASNFYLTPSFGDLDGDGDMDLVIGNQSGKIIFYRNRAGAGAPLAFDEPVFNYMNIDVGSHANPTIVDVDGDGLNDLVIGESNGNNDPDAPIKCSHLNYFKNIGSATAPMFNANINQAPNQACFGRVNTRDIRSTNKGYASPQFLMQGDDLALVVGTKHGHVRLYKNIRERLDGAFEIQDNFLGRIDVGERAQPILWDLDNDDKLELIIGNLAGGLMIYNTDMTIDALVSTDPLLSQQEVHLSPNPVDDRIYLDFDADMFQYVSLYTIQGQCVLTESITPRQTISVASLPSGYYLLQLIGAKTNKTIRFVKN